MIKNNQEILLDFADFAALQKQLEDNLMVSISRAWYNGSYTMAAKAIKSLELHHTMIQFLIIENIQNCPKQKNYLNDVKPIVWLSLVQFV